MEDRKIAEGIIYTKHSPIDSTEKGFEANYRGFAPGSTVLHKGRKYAKGYGKLPCDILYERDVAVVLRDGITIYCDVFRPTTEEPVPAIVAWGPYGKNGSGCQSISLFPGKLGVHADELSGLFMFEAPDPGYWVNRGYAVCNVDIRGTFMSEGDTPYWGEQDGRDGYDFIEWAASQPWCNGRVGMSGNSWLGVSQWHIAAQQPPHLMCIAPWESSVNMYEDDIVRGGVDSSAFCRMIIKGLFGNGFIENPPEMVAEHPLRDEYWKSKVPTFDNIVIPAYVVASWSSQVHTAGTLAAWNALPGEDKWLRIHNNLEWTDYYERRWMDDLCRFFDKYLKQVDSGWENTPKIRMSVLDLGGTDIVNRVEQEFPLARTNYKKLFLADGKALSDSPQQVQGFKTYNAETSEDYGVFEYEFSADTEMTGYSKLHLWVQADSYENADLFVYIQKIGRDGKVALHHPVTPDRQPWKFLYGLLDMESNNYRGPIGRLRCSLRHVDKNASTDAQPKLTYDIREPLEPGVPVCVEIPFWPTSMVFHAGEKLRLLIAGNDLVKPIFDTMDPIRGDNVGTHTLRFGGDYESYLQIPIVFDTGSDR